MPLIVYRGKVSLRGDLARTFEDLFASHGWLKAWRDGIYDFQHFHSSAHEVLGLARGSARVRFGGPNGCSIDLRLGDVAILPAGTGHCCEEASSDLLVVGAYSDGRAFDIRRGDLAEYAEVTANIRRVPLPRQDPVGGNSGALIRLWRRTWPAPG